MSLRDFFVTTISALLLAPLVYSFLSQSFAQVMQSSNYRIQADSINFAGGFSSSTNYVLESTVGEIATGEGSSTNYGLRAGYQQMVTTFISMSSPDSVTMGPSIPGITGGTANGSTTVTVTTDSASGYSLTILASQSPALRNGANTIADYVPGGVPDFTFTTDATDAHFGYSPSGVDTASRFKDDGGTCNAGLLDTALACWDGLDTASETIAQRASANTPSGSTTTINFRVGIGGSVVQTAGVYTATATLTALPI